MVILKGLPNGIELLVYLAGLGVLGVGSLKFRTFYNCYWVG
jgi:hypothetical protein